MPTPCYIYSRKILEKRVQLYLENFPQARIHYAMKANFFPGILKSFLDKGLHLDVVSAGEIDHAFKVGFKPNQILFSGVGKTQAEINFAMDQNIYQINVESEDELNKIIRHGGPARIGLRWTPGLDVKTHPFIQTSHEDTKFGLSREDILGIIPVMQKHKQLKIQGLSLHLGSQLHDVEDFRQAFTALKELIAETGASFETLDLGGGLGVDYTHSDVSKDEELILIYRKMIEEVWQGSQYQILFEPGRFLTARAGGLLTEVQSVKRTKNKTIVVVDTGMNHLIRPALYDAYHDIKPLILRNDSLESYDVVGPICESSDYLALERKMPPVQPGDRVWIADAGAYGSSMMSDYNLRPKAPEVFIEDL